jgi:hypothetical protein
MLPQCRYLIVCMNGRVTATGEQVMVTRPGGMPDLLTETGGGHLALLDPVPALRPPTGRRYPGVFDGLFLYAQVSGGSGRHDLGVELVRWYLGQTYQVFRTAVTPLDFGRDRAAPHDFRVRLAPIVFPTAGQYTFHLLCDGTEIGRAELELLEAP